ncbi:tRNA 2-thiouridine(34) synthase MnmA [Candidatus Parcubacteria bacterium]|nr:MAG: tRNA 2-thiouridine(34) synthase MnmA [Candidatus Parcubacteria bacterium]
MSGGVDSSVAALLLQRLKKVGATAGASEPQYDLVGCYIKGWYPPATASLDCPDLAGGPASSAGKPQSFYCTWKEDRRDAMRVCAKLGIPFITVDAEKEYKKEVVDYMVREYESGRTPNPDIMCNKNIKFGVFLKKAMEMGADYIATGHYVCLRQKFKIQNSKLKTYVLAPARDLNKDQSYFLWTLTQEQLRHCLFPLGNLTKLEVRKIAKENGLATAEKEESQGVCFIGEFDMEDFLKTRVKAKRGKIETDKGKIIGEHDGLAFYTIGQRHGFGYGGGKGGPYYVVDKDFKNNRLVVAEKFEEKNFGKREVEVDNVNWIGGKAPDLDKTYLARIRYRQPLEECRIRIKNQELRIKNKISSSIRDLKFLILFKNPQRAVTSGQSLVIYDGEEMLGGGIIR